MTTTQRRYLSKMADLNEKNNFNPTIRQWIVILAGLGVFSGGGSMISTSVFGGGERVTRSEINQLRYDDSLKQAFKDIVLSTEQKEQTRIMKEVKRNLKNYLKTQHFNYEEDQ